MWLLQSDWLVRVERRVDWKLLLLNRSRPVRQSNTPRKGTYLLSADLTQSRRKESQGTYSCLQAPAPQRGQELDLLCCRVDLFFYYILDMPAPSALIHPNVLHHDRP